MASALEESGEYKVMKRLDLNPENGNGKKYNQHTPGNPLARG
jgi:hypothetical protein